MQQVISQFAKVEKIWNLKIEYTSISPTKILNILVIQTLSKHSNIERR